MIIKNHAFRRWIQRAPRGFNTESDLLLAVQTGRVVREEGTTRWIVGFGMVLIIKEDAVVTCWRATSCNRYLRIHDGPTTHS